MVSRLQPFAVVPVFLLSTTLPVVADTFTRGDCNADGNVVEGELCDISDAVFLLNFLFIGGEKPSCMAACDCDANGKVNLTDAIYELNYCFQGGPAPAEPFPQCGFELKPTLECLEFPPCKVGCAPQDAQGVGPCEMIVGIER